MKVQQGHGRGQLEKGGGSPSSMAARTRLIELQQDIAGDVLILQPERS